MEQENNPFKLSIVLFGNKTEYENQDDIITKVSLNIESRVIHLFYSDHYSGKTLENNEIDIKISGNLENCEEVFSRKIGNCILVHFYCLLAICHEHNLSWEASIHPIKSYLEKSRDCELLFKKSWVTPFMDTKSGGIPLRFLFYGSIKLYKRRWIPFVGKSSSLLSIRELPFSLIVPDIFVGIYPDSSVFEELQNNALFLKKKITFFDFTESNERDPNKEENYRMMLNKHQDCMSYFNFGFKDMTYPQPQIIEDFLQQARETMKSHSTFYLHCKFGLGRSATMCVLFLIKIFKFSLNEGIGTVRLKRPGSIFSLQYEELRKNIN